MHGLNRPYRGNYYILILNLVIVAGWQGGMKYFALWQRAVFINLFAQDSVNREVINDPQLTFSVTKSLFF